VTSVPGLMQYQPLLLSGILDHAAQNFGAVPIVSSSDGVLFRYTYAHAAARARRVASSLQRLGVRQGDFIGSLAWTTHRHFELMYAVPGIGAVLHTANPRLSLDHISFTINHTGERVLFVDPECFELLVQLRPLLRQVETTIVMGHRVQAPEGCPGHVLFYEDLVAAGEEGFCWPQFDERAASTLCFTSGTTGDPKGVLYSHRGTYLSSLTIAAPNAWGVSREDAIIALAPFYHCNAWGATYLGPMAGAKLILPGRALDGRSLRELIVNEGATVGPGVPTVWLAVAEHCRQHQVRLGRLNRIVCGGAAPPLELMRALWREHGVRTVQVWGMTETTHAATLLWTEQDVLSGSAEPRTPQGHPIVGTQIRIIDDDGKCLPHDGKTIGHLQVRGHWCASGYLKRDEIALNDAEGWLKTGDLATIDADCGLRITDRLKDVIKSGGEWVSSIDLENAALGHPDVAAAAVIGVPHPKWQERPVIFVVPRSGRELSADSLREHLAVTVARWWLPDEVIMVTELPYNSTGKVKKDVLRERYRQTRSSG